MNDDETFKHMPSLAPSDPPSRSDEVDNQFRHLSYKLDELIGIVSQLNGDGEGSKLTTLTDKLDDLDTKLEDLDTKLTDTLDDLDTKLTCELDQLDTKLTDKLDELNTKLDELDTTHIAMFKLCAVVAAFIALIYWGDENDPWWHFAFTGGAYLWFLNWIRKQ